MEKTTIAAREISPEEQWFLRKQIVKLHLKGFSSSDIAYMLDVKIRHVQSIIKKYKDDGWEAVSLKVMGRPKGSNKTLHAINTNYGDGSFKPNTKLMLLYDHLKALGYAPSKEEWQLVDGSHELFAQAEDD